MDTISSKKLAEIIKESSGWDGTISRCELALRLANYFDWKNREFNSQQFQRDCGIPPTPFISHARKG